MLSNLKTNTVHFYFIFLFCLVGFLTGWSQKGYAQTAVEQHRSAEVDTFRQFYNVNFDLSYDKFYREHDPIDGNTVQMIPCRTGELYGFVKPGKPDQWIITPRYEQVFGVYEDIAIVKDTSYYYGLINSLGEYLCLPVYSNLFKEGKVFRGIYYASGDSTMGLPEEYDSYYHNDFFNEQGQLIFTEKVHNQRSFIGTDSLAWFRFGSTYHIRSNSGRLVKSISKKAKKQFVAISDNLLIYKERMDTTTLYSAVDAEGRLVFSLPLAGFWIEGIYRLSDNLFGLLAGEGDYMFCDSLGNIKPYGSFSWAVGFFSSDPEYFEQKYFTVTSKDRRRKGMIDRNGKIVLDFKYQVLSPPISGIAFGMDSMRKSSFISTDGDIAPKMIQHDSTTAFNLKSMITHHGRTLQRPIGFYEDVCLGIELTIMEQTDDSGKISKYVDMDSTNYFYFNREGNKVLTLPTSYTFAGVFTEGLAPALNSNRKLGFINKEGEWAIQPEFELTMAGAYPIPYVVVPEFLGGYAYIKSFKGYIDRKGNKYFTGKRMQDHYNFSH